MNKSRLLLKAHIKRNQRGIYISYIRYRKKLHTLSTGTTLREAALDFNEAHLLKVLKKSKQDNPPTPSPPQTQPLFL